ncbi:hypothetical protein BDC45DRAFT_538051 [Circinella umbellata]|nr:hypothetical protein BDC45DRAFT_538051 [Circinella umbellata]
MNKFWLCFFFFLLKKLTLQSMFSIYSSVSSPSPRAFNVINIISWEHQQTNDDEKEDKKAQPEIFIILDANFQFFFKFVREADSKIMKFLIMTITKISYFQEEQKENLYIPFISVGKGGGSSKKSQITFQ